MFTPKAPKNTVAASFDTLSEYPPNEKAELLSTIDISNEITTTIRNHKGSLKNNL